MYRARRVNEHRRRHPRPPFTAEFTDRATNTEVTGDLQAALDRLERELVVEALKSTRGNRAAAARRLGITERVMGLRVDKYDIAAKRFK